MTITEARSIVGKQLGFGENFGGTPASYAALTQAQQIQLNAEVSNYIRSHQDEFTSDQVALALRSRADGKVEDTSFDWGMFVGEVGNNARSINPLDPLNIGKVGTNLLIGAIILGGFYIYLKTRKA